MGKKYLDTKQNTLEAAVLQVWQVAAEEMDPVNPKAAAKKFKDRKDKDIDNDGDVDSSDKYLHKRRKAIGKAMKKEGLEDSPNPANSQHLCAKNVVHEEWGEGQPVHGMHAMPDVDGNIAWYDVMFEHGIEKGVSINELKVTVAEKHHNHGGKKKNEGAMKRGKDMDTFKPKPQNEEVELEKHREFKVQSMRDAMEQVWEVSADEKLFEDIELMTEDQYDEFLDSLNEEEVNEIIRAIGRGIKKVATYGTAASRADRAEKKQKKAEKRGQDIARADAAKRATAAARQANPTLRMKAKKAVGGAAKAMIIRAYQNQKLKPPPNIDSLIEEFLEFYFENCSNRSFLYPNVFNTLRKLKSKFKIALCTNKKQFITEKILMDFKIKDFFDCVLGSNSKI